MVEVIFASDNDTDEWNEFVENTSLGSLYHMWEWGETLSSICGYRRYYLSAVQQERMVGILPLIHVKSILFGNRLISLPFCEYGGPLVVSDGGAQEKKRVMKALVNDANKLARTLGVGYVEMRKPVTEDAEEIMNAHGYTRLRRYVTFRLDLTKDPDGLWANMHKSTRKAIRKALRNEVTTEKVEEEAQLRAFYMLYLRDMKRHGSPPHEYALFKKLFDSFQEDSRMRVLLAKYRGHFIGGRIVFCDGRTVFCWNSVSDVKYRNLNPGNLLLWETIEWGLKNSYQFLEMGRTRKGTTVYDYKKGWGGQEVSLNEYIYFIDSNQRELPDPAQTTYRCLAGVWSWVPIGLAEKIGPKVLSGIAL